MTLSARGDGRGPVPLWTVLAPSSLTSRLRGTNALCVESPPCGREIQCCYEASIAATSAGVSPTTTSAGGKVALDSTVSRATWEKVTRRGSGTYLKRWVTAAPPFDHAWHTAHVLRFMRPGEEHTVEVWWDVEWSFLGWYVNLQAPLVVRNDRFDTTDWVLDVVVDPDGTWRWKDEDEFAQAFELGVFESEAAAAAVRNRGRARDRRTTLADWMGGLASAAELAATAAA